MRLWRKYQASKRGIPFEKKELWPPYYVAFSGKLPADLSMLHDIYKFRDGQVAPVFKSATEIHFYKIVRTSRAPGDDHIVSPLQFDIEYHHSEALP